MRAVHARFSRSATPALLCNRLQPSARTARIFIVRRSQGAALRLPRSGKVVGQVQLAASLLYLPAVSEIQCFSSVASVISGKGVVKRFRRRSLAQGFESFLDAGECHTKRPLVRPTNPRVAVSLDAPVHSMALPGLHGLLKRINQVVDLSELLIGSAQLPAIISAQQTQ